MPGNGNIILLMVGSDYSQAAVGGAIRFARSFPKPRYVVVSGGSTGGLKRPEFRTEAAFLMAGVKASGMPVPLEKFYMEDTSGGVIEHVNKSLDLIRDKHLDMSDGLVLSQAPMQQLRNMWILENAAEQRGLHVIIQNSPPVFWDMKMAPDSWESLGEHQRRLLFEGVREIYMIFGAQKMGAISRKKMIDPIFLEAAMRAGHHLLTDETVPEDKKADIRIYLAEIQAHLPSTSSNAFSNVLALPALGALVKALESFITPHPDHPLLGLLAPTHWWVPLGLALSIAIATVMLHTFWNRLPLHSFTPKFLLTNRSA